MSKDKIFTRLSLVLCSFIIFTSALAAGEVDSATQRNEVLKKNPHETLSILNTYTRKMLSEAVELANSAGGASCQPNDRSSLHRLQDAVYKKLGSLNDAVPGKMDQFIRKGPELKNHRECIDKSQSIYKEIGRLQAPALWVEPSLGCAVNVNGQMVGYDKFDHFFLQGWSYFREAYSQPQAVDQANRLTEAALQKALDFGDRSEKGKFGLTTTAVYSPGDLAANYEGMKFWACLTKDHCPKGEAPFITCRQGRWKVNQGHLFDWGKIVNPAWDELKNPNYYSSKEIAQTVEKNIRTQGFNVPLSSKACLEVFKAYRKVPQLAKNIVSPHCINLLSTKKLQGPHGVTPYSKEEAQEKEQELFQAAATCQRPTQVCGVLYEGFKEIALRNWWCRFSQKL